LALDDSSLALDDSSFAFDDNSWHQAAVADGNQRVLLHLGRHLRRVVDPRDVCFLEAVGQTTRVRLRSARELRDTRSLGELMATFSAFGLVRVHRNHAVNLGHVVEVRRRKADADWEVAFEPPVSRVLPVSRARVRPLWAAFGEALPPRRPRRGASRARRGLRARP
jgi:DNA-binding LytR/AlgR family response regulator